MSSSDVIDQLLNGCSLYTYMQPDDRIPTNKPFHSESFALPNIVIKDNIFWGMPRPGYSIGQEKKEPEYSVFAYTNGFNGIFASCNFGTSRLLLMQLNRYKEHRFITRNRWSLVWDSHIDGDNKKK